MKKFLIVDGNSIFYRAFYALPPLSSPKGEPTGAVVGFANIVLKVLRERTPDLAVVAFDTGKKTFRNHIFPEYKATRPPMPDDLAAQLPLLKELIEVAGLKTCASMNYEADDVIGTLARQACESVRVEILTGDRDALQLINAATRVLLTKYSTVDIYDERKFMEEYGFAPPLLVDFKGLRGDPSDNIPGVKGIGEITAKKLIKTYGKLEDILAHRDEISSKKVKDALETQADIALLSKRLAQIICKVPRIAFNEDDFQITPNFPRVDKLCNRYALNYVKKRIHEIFDPANLFDNTSKKVVALPEIQPFDLEKILAADSLIFAQEGKHFAIKIGGGDIFSAEYADVQTVFTEFGGQITLGNLKSYLRQFEIPDLEKIFDEELAAYLLYPEWENYSSERLLPLEFDGLRMPDNSLAANVVALEKLAALYSTKISDADLTRLYREIELPLTKVLARMEMRGVFVNKKNLKAKAADMTDRINALREKIFELAGETFNLNSSKQLADVLFVNLKLPPVKKTKTGYSTDAEVLEELKWRHPIIPAILEYRTLIKLKSVYLEGLGKLLDAKGRVHTNFNQTVTATGRLSSSNPNLQNIPVRTDEGRAIRALFEAGAGYDCLVSADYSQIELRLLAHMSGDENLIDAFKRGQDIHARTAAEVFDVPIAGVTPDLRRKAKAVNFGIVYGISDYGLSRDLNISRKEAGEYIALYFERYPGVKEFLNTTVTQAHLHGYVTTMFGRRRFLPDINSKNFNARTLAQRMAMNTPIQGSAADIIKLAMIRAEANLRGLQSRLILQVHDELVVEAKNSELAEVERILREAMEGVIQLKVPLIVDIHSGANWSLAK